MPRKTKEQIKPKNEENKRNTAKKVTTAKKKSPSKTTTVKKSSSKKTQTKKVSKADTSIEKKVSTAKKASTKKSTAKKTTETQKKTSTRKKSNTSKSKNEIVEYYDLPYRYNQTVVKILAQTPTVLFIYWDISDKDRDIYKKQYGENFFENTKPVLIVTNTTLNYSFEVEINDFANSWYLNINDSKCDYKVELGRRTITKNEKLNIDYIYISDSNEIETPNDRILFDKNMEEIYFKNIKTGVQTKIKINTPPFIKNIRKLYNIYDIYDINQKSLITNMDILSNPSSGSVYNKY